MLSEQKLERLFLYCLTWSLGGLLDVKERPSFDAELRSIASNMPPRYGGIWLVHEGPAWCNTGHVCDRLTSRVKLDRLLIYCLRHLFDCMAICCPHIVVTIKYRRLPHNKTSSKIQL